MNGKTAKALRRTLKERGKDPTEERTYLRSKETGQIINGSSGRRIYQGLKKKV